MVYSVRQRCGRQLAKEAPVDVDLVSTVPDSATPAALAYAAQVWSFINLRLKYAVFSVKNLCYQALTSDEIQCSPKLRLPFQN